MTKPLKQQPDYFNTILSDELARGIKRKYPLFKVIHQGNYHPSEVREALENRTKKINIAKHLDA